jgi:uncharacterized 2Fe-2S/4Fe-4S cluster protein (DUF4445 family)
MQALPKLSLSPSAAMREREIRFILEVYLLACQQLGKILEDIEVFQVKQESVIEERCIRFTAHLRVSFYGSVVKYEAFQCWFPLRDPSALPSYIADLLTAVIRAKTKEMSQTFDLTARILASRVYP